MAGARRHEHRRAARLIRRILDHPDGFTGEVVVAENSQFNSIDGFDRAANNAQDHQQSPHDVVVHFQAQGHRVSHFDWTVTRQTKVLEYSTGELRSGYVVGPYDSGYLGRISYPKFQTAHGTRISLKYGLWSEAADQYDRTHLKFINCAGAQVAPLDVRRDRGRETLHGRRHRRPEHQLPPRDRLRDPRCGDGRDPPADLNILDATWINANPYAGPYDPYSGATRRDELVASTDPVALDRWR